MQFVHALNPKRIVLQINCADRSQALSTVADMFAECDERLDATAVKEALLHREMLTSTNLGKGVAIPHTRVPNLGEPHLVITIIREGMDFEDGLDPVKIIAALLFDDADSTSHLNVLMQLARILQNPIVRHRMASAKNAKDILDALIFGKLDYSMHCESDSISAASVPAGYA